MATAIVERVTYGDRDKRNDTYVVQEGYEELPQHSGPTPPPQRAGEVSEPLTSQEQQQLSLWAGGINMAKAMLGIGILALPKVAALLGIGTTLLFLIFVAALTMLSLHYMTVASSRTGLSRYSDLVREHCGLFGQALLDLSLIVNGTGVLIIALIVIGDVLVGGDGAQGLLSDVCGDRGTVLAAFTIILIAPLVSVTRLRSVAGASALGIAAIVLWAVLTVLLFGVAWADGLLHTMEWWPHGRFVGHGFESAVQVLATLPVLLVAYICQMSLQHTLRELHSVADEQVDRVSWSALALTTVAYAAIAICSYGLFGQRVEADVLRSFTVDALSPLVYRRLAQGCFMAVRLGFLVSLITVFPLQMAPLRDALWKLLFRQELQGPGLWVVTYGILAGIYSCAAWLTSIWEPLVLIGSTAGVLLALVFPGVLAIATPEVLTERAGARAWRIAGGAALIAVGAVVGVFGVLRVLLYRDPLGA